MASDHSSSQATTKPLSQTIAYVDGKPVQATDMLGTLYETAGGESLSDLILDRMLADESKTYDLVLTQDMIKRERDLILNSLDADPDQAQRLLNKLRRERGLGETRFPAMLERNAMLRQLIQPEVNLTNYLMRQQFDLIYGPKFQPRLIIVPELIQANELRKRALAGESFSDLAALNSTDISARQGGLLAPISLADTNYPQNIREAIAKLEDGSISDLIAMDNGYAFIQLYRTIEAQPVQYAEVESEVARILRNKLEATLMRQKAAELVRKANVTILEPLLLGSWKQQKARFLDAN
ncbi:peptidylprolyl isomerase [Poriferisphaera sp. WC338]|uniref:peptidylprolyl isomerase n=1 Tax=Poriferisphaera sp. WC338 TaxID=3425129 RepID=UPI003D819321